MFEATQARMRAFEHLEGLLLPPEMHTVVRLELNNAQALFDDESLSLSGPLDGRFAKSMLKTAAHLIRETPESLFTFVAGDELVLLLDVESFIDRRSPRTLVARFVSMAAGKASLLFERSVSFDCHIYSLPGEEQAGDFFAWRQQAYDEWIVTTYCREVMVSNGADSTEAARILKDLTREERLGILEDNEVDWEAIPTWRRRGAGVHWADAEAKAQEGADASGPALVIDTDLPIGDEYRLYIERFLS